MSKFEKKCKDCIHCDFCKNNTLLSEFDENQVAYCQSFKDKSLFVELPCKVGDKVLKMAEWIKVSDRLPEDNQTVLTFSSSGEIEVLTYDNHDIKGTFIKYGGLVRVFNVTHWFPIPTPLQKGDRGMKTIAIIIAIAASLFSVGLKIYAILKNGGNKDE